MTRDSKQGGVTWLSAVVGKVPGVDTHFEACIKRGRFFATVEIPATDLVLMSPVMSRSDLATWCNGALAALNQGEWK